jgi:hypothetical protein
MAWKLYPLEKGPSWVATELVWMFWGRDKSLSCFEVFATT